MKCTSESSWQLPNRLRLPGRRFKKPYAKVSSWQLVAFSVGLVVIARLRSNSKTVRVLAPTFVPMQYSTAFFPRRVSHETDSHAFQQVASTAPHSGARDIPRSLRRRAFPQGASIAPQSMARDIPRSSRFALAFGYTVLLLVNSAFGAGAFGVSKTNQATSAAYPTVLTPAGFTFTIWGAIFALQLLGTIFVALGGTPTASAAILPAWLCGWVAEVIWQLVFACAPIPVATAALSRRQAVLVPSSVLLLIAYFSFLQGAIRLSHSLQSQQVEAPTAVSFFLGLPTGLNAAWLAAAAAIGLSLAAQVVPGIGWLATPSGGSALLALIVVVAWSVILSLGRSPATLALGLGYAIATAWACFGVSKGSAPEIVKSTASMGMKLAALCGGIVSAVCISKYFRKPADSNEESTSVGKLKTIEFGHGLRFVEQIPGDQKTFPRKGDQLTMHYILKLANDPSKVIDSSRDRGTPFTFKIGTGQVIKGWDEGVMQMSLGQRGTLFVPSDLGYGSRGVGGIIPADADLSFDVEILRIDGVS